MKFIPLHDKVLIKRREADEQVGSIHIPTQAQEKPQEGTVVACGEGKVLDGGSVRPMGVSVDDFVLFGKYAGSEVSIHGETLLLLREDEILGYFRE